MPNIITKPLFNAIMAISILGILATASPAYADKKMDARMSMHHMHILINHAMQMAAEGGNLVMIGGMGMAKSLDEQSVKHGKMMIGHANQMIDDIMDGKVMKDLHAGGLEGDLKEMMASTHDLASNASAYIKKLKDMKGGAHAGHGK